ncbi:uncharacterized protein LOC117558306 [Gymnodraco acuticeps]|uniref:Uncharacterized protein LOC117558306 n=1 Tax=Gymnodraco acuticeps TaxID=8218 RepID=A0A6P8VIQ5_GYMAC|nr:uncharacterized protein LOC117558306 [Gymnodraco acuticeps]
MEHSHLVMTTRLGKRQRNREQYYWRAWTITKWFLCILAMIVVLGLVIYFMYSWSAHSRSAKIEVSKRYMGKAGRTTWEEGLIKTGIGNITLRDGEDSTVQLDPCDYMHCSDPKKLGWADAYICYVEGSFGQTANHCSGGWAFVLWTTAYTDWGYTLWDDKTNIKGRLSISKVNSSSPVVLLQLQAAQISDGGYYVVCMYVSGTDPCGTFYIDIAPKTQTPKKDKPPLTQTLTSIGTSTLLKRNLYIGNNDHNNIDVVQTSNGNTGNVWWHTLRSFLQAAGQNGSCYACTLFPQDSSMSVPVRPRSLTQVEHLCAFMALTRPIEGEDRVTEWRYARQLPPPCSNKSNSLLRAYTVDTTYAKYQPVSHVHPSHLRGMKHSICIQRVYHKTSLTPPYFSLGTTTGCTRILQNTCSYGVYNSSYCIFSVPERILSNVAFPDVNHTSLQLAWPSDAGFSAPQDYVWLCGDKLYQMLAPLWIGTCTLVDLNPAVTVLTSLMYTTHHYPEFQHPDHHKVKRELTSTGVKFFGGLFPWWGTVNNAHNIDTLHVRLENLTYETTQGFQALPPFIIASRNMLMQQFALDLCHIICLFDYPNTEEVRFQHGILSFRSVYCYSITRQSFAPQ